MQKHLVNQNFTDPLVGTLIGQLSKLLVLIDIKKERQVISRNLMREICERRAEWDVD